MLRESVERPPQTGGDARPARARPPTRRQYVRFAFYTIDPLWRRLSPARQARDKRELIAAIERFDRHMLLRPYSLMGTRADAELLLWQIAESVEPFHELAAVIASTGIGAYLRLAASYLSQTKRSVYEIRDLPGAAPDRLRIDPSEAKYLFVYPFIKTRQWYHLPLEERQSLMDEHIRVGRKYPAVKLNTTYSFGLDDQEFVVAFETDEPSDFLDLVQELRETRASLYTLRDTPLYACLRMTLEESLDALGGPTIARPATLAPAHERWVEVCPRDELAPGDRRLVYLAGQQVAVLNVQDQIYAISNRCSHARGPLGEGEIEIAGDRCTVTCPWHFGVFDLRTGEAVDGLASAPVPTYQVELRDGVIYIGTRMVEPRSPEDPQSVGGQP
jgi:chlorite dismutase